MKTVIAWIGAFLVAAAIVLGIYAANVALSPTTAKTEAYRQKNTSSNFIAQQAWFEDTYNDIKAADRNLDIPGQPIEIQGRTAYCNDLVADYNANAKKYIAADFRSADLPAQIDDSDPTTDCKETAK